MNKRLINIRIIFAALMVMAFGYGTYESFSFGFLAKIFPLYISMFCLILGLIDLGIEIRRSWKGAQDSGRGLADLESDWDISMTAVMQRFCEFMALLLILYVGIWLIGYPITITLFLVFFYRFLTETTWRIASLAGIAGLAFISLISKLMVIDWPSGIIQDWIDLPWPLG